MPPRPPPQPSTLTLLCSAAALAAVWVSVGVDQVMRGLLGSAFGVPWHGIEISSASYLPRALQASDSELGPAAYTLMILAGPAGILAAAWLLQLFAVTFRTPGWLRGFALVWLVVALLWMPAACAAGSLAGTGPVTALYVRLGAPMAGRWTSFALGLVLLLAVSRLASRQAVQVGRSWMRADALEFRKRLVRVTAGWPGMTALAALAWWVGWAPTPWVVIYVTLVMISLQINTF